jgi:hypothetical protein
MVAEAEEHTYPFPELAVRRRHALVKLPRHIWVQTALSIKGKELLVVERRTKARIYAKLTLELGASI